MRILLVLALLAGFAAPAFSCDITAGPGAVVRLAEGKSGGLASVGCVFKDKWSLRAWYVGEQRIYDETVVIDGYLALSASKLWMFRDGKRIRPMIGLGLLLKGSQRCHYNGDTDCNRQLPLPFCFLMELGVKVGDIVVTAFHCSNSSLDYGPEKKNLGLDGIRGELWF